MPIPSSCYMSDYNWNKGVSKQNVYNFIRPSIGILVSISKEGLLPIGLGLVCSTVSPMLTDNYMEYFGEMSLKRNTETKSMAELRRHFII